MAKAPKKKEETVVAETVEAQQELPLSYEVTLKGHGQCFVGVNGKNQIFKRGEPIIVSPEVYYILKDADEIA